MARGWDPVLVPGVCGMNTCCRDTLAHPSTAAMVAEAPGRHRSYIAHLAQRLGVGTAIGTSGRIRTLSEFQ